MHKWIFCKYLRVENICNNTLSIISTELLLAPTLMARRHSNNSFEVRALLRARSNRKR